MLSLQENDFKSEVLDAKGLVLVDFWAEWCGPCRQLGPILEKASEQIADVKFCKVNVDEAPNTAASFGIRSIPSMFLFKDGKQIDVKVGFSSEASIVDWLNSYK
ncbi:MAG: thioredoxin [Alphaproteobacteria bacterium]|nr:thioredoxin [Alphaproteobacteria bacterium]